MFNTFFNGTVDDLLNHVGTAPAEEIRTVDADNKILNREECIQSIMDSHKIDRELAEKCVTEIQMEEFNRIIQSLLEKGMVEVTGYDEENQPIYKPVEKL